jgi:hypothetical protein
LVLKHLRLVDLRLLVRLRLVFQPLKGVFLNLIWSIMMIMIKKFLPKANLGLRRHLDIVLHRKRLQRVSQTLILQSTALRALQSAAAGI